MVEIRDGQEGIANQNPNILSNLSGQQSSDTNINPPPGTGQANQVAQDLSSTLYEGGPVAGLENQADAMTQELFNYDQMLEQNYNPLPTPNWYVPNPADMSATMAGLAGQTAQNIGTTQNMIGTTERAYDAAIGAVLDRFTEFMRLQQEQKRHEEEMKLAREKLALERQRLGGGGGGNSLQAAMAALFGGGQGGALQGMEVVPDNYIGPLGQNQIRQADVMQMQAGGGLNQQRLMQALMMTDSPTEAKLIMELYNQFGQPSGGMSDLEAIYEVSRQGGADLLKTVPEEQRGQFARQMLRGGVPQQMTEGDKKAVGQIKALKEMYDMLSKEYGQLSTLGTGRIGGIFGNLAQVVGWNPELTDYESLRESSITPIARIISGETGPITQGDIERAEKMLPSVYDSEREAYAKFARLADLIETRMSVIQSPPVMPNANIPVTPGVGPPPPTQGVLGPDQITQRTPFDALIEDDEQENTGLIDVFAGEGR